MEGRVSVFARVCVCVCVRVCVCVCALIAYIKVCTWMYVHNYVKKIGKQVNKAGRC